MVHKVYLYISILILLFVIAFGLALNFSINRYNQYVVKVNGEKVSLDEFKIYLKIVKKAKENKAGVVTPEEIKKLWSEPIEGLDPAVFARQEALDYVIRFKIIEQKAREKNLILTKEDEKELTGTVVNIFGLQIEEFEKVKRDRAYLDKLFTYITKDIKLTDKEFNEFLVKNPDLFIQYKVRHILFKTVDENLNPLPKEEQEKAFQTANIILQRVKKGEDFSKLAKEYSQDLGTKALGGKYEFYKGEPVKEFEDAVMKLKPGEISDLVKTQFGYHIIILDSVNEASGNELERIKAKYRNDLERKKKIQFFEEQFRQWKQDAKIEINQKLLNSIDIKQI